MAIPWFTMLQIVPWKDVIRNAPKVADGAKKLWSNIGKKPAIPEREAPMDNSALSPEAQVIARLQTQLTAVEATAADLQAHLLASTELITALADQNAQLIKHIETNRVRVLWLTVVIALVGIIATASLILALVH